jgi:hypothetical protein
MRKMLNSCMCITIRYWGSQPNVPKFEVSVTHHIMYPIQIAIWLYHMVYQAHRIAAHSSAEVVHATAMNAQSSRGHTICKLTVVKEVPHRNDLDATVLR